ncbi:MAG: prephenate dehydratase [Victivallaceae bacterium]
MALDKLREKIEHLDRQIVSLINERYRYVQEVGKWKKDNALSIYVPEREKALLKKLSEFNEGPMTEDILRAIYREIMSGALKLEMPLKVTFLGPEGTFTHQAALAKFGHSVEYHPTASIAGVFKDIETGRADYGCVPIENSTEGAVNYTLDTLMMSTVGICAELNLRIHHNLMSRHARNEITRIYSHPQTFGQCRQYLQENFPGIEQVEAGSNTRAAALAAAEEGAAAIAPAIAAEMFQMNFIAENIEDFSNNTTRFMIVGNQSTIATGDDKTSICFAIKDKVGALYDCIKPFKDEEITMTMIESRPIKSSNWEYCFFIDLLGHRNDEKLLRASELLEKKCSFFKILGSYPRSF